MFGDFVKIPMDLLCNDIATPSTRIAAIMFFEWNFDINKDGNYSIKRKEVQIDAVATYYGINKTTFRSRIQKAKKVELIDYKTIKTGKETTIIINAKVYKYVRVWVREDSLSAKKAKKLQEQAKKETIIEEEETTNDKIYSSSIEELIDYEAKSLSKSQCYIYYFTSSLVDYLQEMIADKGREETINYMKEKWPNIDLDKLSI